MFVLAVPLSETNAEPTLLAFQKFWLLSFGPPMQLHTEEGTNFESPVFTDLHRLWRIQTNPNHRLPPPRNGACERGNCNVHATLKRLLNDGHVKDWDLYLQQAVYAYNTSVPSATGHTHHILT